MTPEDTFIELLDRVAALQGASTLLSAEELAQWPGEAVATMKAQKLITRARPASSAVCPSCEEECVMPVHAIAVSSGEPGLFILCDKRDDISRVPVPHAQLERWQASGDSIADLLAGLLGLQRPNCFGAQSTPATLCYSLGTGSPSTWPGIQLHWMRC